MVIWSILVYISDLIPIFIRKEWYSSKSSCLVITRYFDHLIRGRPSLVSTANPVCIGPTDQRKGLPLYPTPIPLWGVGHWLILDQRSSHQFHAIAKNMLYYSSDTLNVSSCLLRKMLRTWKSKERSLEILGLSIILLHSGLYARLYLTATEHCITRVLGIRCETLIIGVAGRGW